jgi:Tfp pilus assembly protein PilE
MKCKARSPRVRGSSSRRGVVSAKIIVLVLAVVLLGAYLYHQRPNLYDRTRTDLLEASRELERYHQDMEVLVQEEQRSADALRATIAKLQKAAVLEPKDVAEIESITTELQSWEQQALSGQLSSSELHHSYQSLVERVDLLIKKHSKLTDGQ